MPEVALARLAAFRSDAYRLLAQVFLYPTRARVAAVRKAASHLGRQQDLLGGLAIGHQWTALLRTLQELPTQRIPDLQVQFTRLFGLDGAGGCPPYESSYAAVLPGQGAAILNAVEEEYAEEGVAVDATAGEPPDHASVELEFMAILCAREAAAWSAASAEHRARLLVIEQQFLYRHLGGWFPRLAQAVTAAGPGSLYAEAAGTAASLIHHDQDLVDLLRSRLADGIHPVREAASAGDR